MSIAVPLPSYVKVLVHCLATRLPASRITMVAPQMTGVESQSVGRSLDDYARSFDGFFAG